MADDRADPENADPTENPAENAEPSSSQIEPVEASLVPDDHRRGFLGRAGVCLAAGLSAAGLSPLLGALLNPIQGGVVRIEGATIDAGPTEAFGPLPQKVVVSTARVDAWTRTDHETVGAIYVRRVGSDVIAFSSICPHAGCGVSFEQERDRFVCPCHQSDFDKAGTLVAGPGPRPLDRLPVRIEDGRVLVTYERYRLGIARKEKV